MWVMVCNSCGEEHVPEDMNLHKRGRKGIGRYTSCENCGQRDWSIEEVHQTMSSDVDAWEQEHNDSIGITNYDERFVFS